MDSEALENAIKEAQLGVARESFAEAAARRRSTVVQILATPIGVDNSHLIPQLKHAESWCASAWSEVQKHSA